MSEPKIKVVNLALEGTLLPPAPDKCQSCARTHDPVLPHDQQSVFWQYWFYKQSGGRWPTWDDAMAHCSPEVREAWKVALERVTKERGLV